MSKRSDQDRRPAVGSTLPSPAPHSRWRWASPRRALLGGGILATMVGLASADAGASTAQGAQPPPSTTTQRTPPIGGTKPTTGGKITALSTDLITIETPNRAKQAIAYSTSTKFRTLSGSSSSSALKLGEFVAVVGSETSDRGVTATTIVISTSPSGTPARGPGKPTGGPLASHNARAPSE